MISDWQDLSNTGAIDESMKPMTVGGARSGANVHLIVQGNEADPEPSFRQPSTVERRGSGDLGSWRKLRKSLWPPESIWQALDRPVVRPKRRNPVMVFAPTANFRTW